MNRKAFIAKSAQMAAVPFLLGGALQGCTSLSDALRKEKQGKILVLIQLDGGNDGLNTVIPLDQYSNLSNSRADIMVPEKKVIALQNGSATGLHPSLAPLKRLYDTGKLSIIQGVGYPDPVFSHFRAIDIWHTASGAKDVFSSGWLGRFLDKKYPGFPESYPNQQSPDPPAIQLGNLVSQALLGPSVSMGMAVDSTADFYKLVLGKSSVLDTPRGRELSFISQTATQTQKYLLSVKKSSEAQKNLSLRYPKQGKNPLADQLKMAAQLIGGGLQTKVYMANIKGFDTHHNQVEKNDTTIGVHSKLLSQLAEAIEAFVDDLTLMDKLDKVVGMTYSEFGRRIKSNASSGTDHGSSGPVIMFGAGLKGGLIGSNPEIPSNATVDDNLAMQYDYRAVYASLLKGLFKMKEADLESIQLKGYPAIDIFQ